MRYGRNCNDMLCEYPDNISFEHCEQCGARLVGDRWHSSDPTWDEPLHCPVCALEEQAEREQEEEGRMHP